MSEVIDKKTSISLGLLLAIMGPVIITVAAWVTLNMKVQNIETDVSEIKSQLSQLDDKFEDILRTNLFTLNQ